MEQHITISPEDWKIIVQRISIEKAGKSTVLTGLSHSEDKIYYVQEGAMRLYYDGENKEITFNIAFPGTFISSYTSFLTKKKSEFVLQTLTACEFLVFQRDKLEEMFRLTSCGHELGRILSENLFLYQSKRENSFLLRSPTERYLDLFDEQPRLILEIPQKYIASYIGITPQALSRIRAKLE